MAYTDAQKKAIYAYRKRNREKVNYINRKSDAKSFIEMAEKGDLEEMKEMIDDRMKKEKEMKERKIDYPKFDIGFILKNDEVLLLVTEHKNCSIRVNVSDLEEKELMKRIDKALSNFSPVELVKTSQKKWENREPLHNSQHLLTFLAREQNKMTDILKVAEKEKMLNIYDFHPENYPKQKSFHGKAQIVDSEKRIYLKSHDVIVMSKNKETSAYTRHSEEWNATTGRHIFAFSGLRKKDFEKLSIISVDAIEEI